MKNRRLGGFIATVLLGVTLFVPAAATADDSELFISRVWPNVLLMIDKSGSMNTASGTTGIGDLDGDGTSNARMDALWKVVYTLLNADASKPTAGSTSGTTTSARCDLKGIGSSDDEDPIPAGTSVSSIRVSDCDKWSDFPSSGNIPIGRRSSTDTVAYSSKGTCSTGHGRCFFFSPAVTFLFTHREGDAVRYSRTTGGSTYFYAQPYPGPTSACLTATPTTCGTTAIGAPTEHNQAISPYNTTPTANLTCADEALLKARIGYMDFTGNLSATYAINIRNQISSSAPNSSSCASPFSATSGIRYRDIWQSIVSNATPDSYTPTAQALVTAKTFFQNAYNATDSCRPNFAILITDGEDTMGMSTSEACSGGYPGCAQGATIPAQQTTRHNRMIEKAAALYDNVYKATLYAVGVGIGTTGGTNAASTNVNNRRLREVLRRSAEQLNEQVTASDMSTIGSTTDNASRGAGRAFFADDATQLASSLSTVFGAIVSGNYVFTSPTVSSVRTSDRNYLFLGSFQPFSPPATIWEGHLYAYTINSLNNLTLQWDADNVLTTAGAASRNVYTADNTTWARIVFDNTTSYSTLSPAMMGVTTNAARDNVINYVRGSTRTMRLGDIYHSKPVLVGEPSPLFSDAGYSWFVGSTGTQSFLDAKKTRKRIVYAGGNDGALHAFLAGTASGTPPTYDHGTGTELFAYVPRALLSKVKFLLPATDSAHRYYVDGSPRAADVWIDANGNNTKESSEWKTVLVGGYRMGGRGYYALDITSPPASGSVDNNYPVVLWENSSTSLFGDSWSEPFISRVKIRNFASGDNVTRDRWVAIVGGGNDDNTVGNSLVVLDVADGSALKVFSGLTDVVVASPVAVMDQAGYVRFVYVTDKSGNLYKFDLRTTGTKNTSMPEWTVRKLFSPDAGGQPSYHRVDVASLTDNRRYVYFGTGNQDSPVSDTGSGKFYAILDDDGYTAPTWPNPYVTESTSGAIADLTSSIGSTAGGARGTYGWKVDFGSINTTTTVSGISGYDNGTHVSEKMLSDPVVFNGRVYFTTYTPIGSNVCMGGGISRVYGLKFETAGAGLTPEAGETPGSGSTTVSMHVYTTLGVASSPTLSINPGGQSSIFIGFSGAAGGVGTVREITIESPFRMKTIKSWREIL